MSLPIAYWLSSFEPDMEAVASEVALLRRHFPRSIAWGLTHRRWLSLSWRRGFGLPPAGHLPFRIATRALEPFFRINHVFGSLADWAYLEGKRWRPTVLTVATHGEPLDRLFLDRIQCFVAEDPVGCDILRTLKIEASRIRLVYPPVDLNRFRPAVAPSGRFTILFTSSPDRADWLEARGVRDLLDAAALRPGMHFRLLWRPWGDGLPVVRQWIRDRNLTNVEVGVGRHRNMASQYHAAHVTLVPFRSRACCKPAPNSLLESLACGRPVLTTAAVGFAKLLEESGAGIAAASSPAALAEGLDRLQADWEAFAGRARALAERSFGVERFLGSYERIYAKLCRDRLKR